LSGLGFAFCSFFSKMVAKFKGENMPKDANGTELNAGDNVTITKDLKVKGAGATLKRGTMVKNMAQLNLSGFSLINFNSF